MPDSINVGGSGFNGTSSATLQVYSLSSATSPLVLSPPPNKVIRLVRLSSSNEIANVSIDVNGQNYITGKLSGLAATAGNFNVNCPQTDISGSSFRHTPAIEPITALEKGQSISIETTDETPENIYYLVSYGDL